MTTRWHLKMTRLLTTTRTTTRWQHLKMTRLRTTLQSLLKMTPPWMTMTARITDSVIPGRPLKRNTLYSYSLVLLNYRDLSI